MSFFKDTKTLITGNLIGQLIPILISPILTRIYSPTDFGTFGLYVAIFTILSSFINGQYHLAIVLPQNKNKAIDLALISFFITFIYSFFILLVIFLFEKQIIWIVKNEEIRPWLYFIPLSIFSFGLFNIFNYFNIREKDFNIISKANILRSSIMSILQIVLGLFKKDVLGLIIGTILGMLISSIYMYAKIKEKIFNINIKRYLILMKIYSDFPKINTINNFLFNTSQYMVFILISIIFSNAYLGFFSLVQRVMMIPTSIIGNAIGQVFFKKIRDQKSQKNVYKEFKNILFKLILISFIVSFIVSFIIKDMFILVFGLDWQEAGEIAKILIPLFFTQFIRSCINIITILYSKQKQQLLINTMVLIITAIIFLITYSLKINFYHMIIIYSTLLTIINILIIYYYTKIIKDFEKYKKD